jgi:nuclear cap-binding protein subunit 1
MLFKTIVEDEESQAVVLKSLHEVWKNHQQMTVIMVDKMLKTQIVECSSIANWIFSKELRSDLTSFYVWEILNSTVNRMNIQVDKLQNDYNECEENYKKNQNNVMFRILMSFLTSYLLAL